MLNPSPSSQEEDCYDNSEPRSFGASCSESHRFLNKHSATSRSLPADLDYSVEQLSTLVEPFLEPPSQCTTPYFIQAATTGKTTFLTTNLAETREAKVTAVSPVLRSALTASTWLIGRSHNCAITVLDRSISRCHAVIGHHPVQGFYVMDVGSTNGTFLNRQRLPILERRVLQDGDLIAFSHLQIEFFMVSTKKESDQSDRTIFIQS
ncbi:MAG: FHA domain-containing protein [Myxacorys chilensis ATA2-1-KO14]|jgi:hypothetical protein|nr:FHA domain-containing protein [Myxacorys chilensis ATA2-1-KO14]